MIDLIVQKQRVFDVNGELNDGREAIRFQPTAYIR